jgi:DNA-binding LacI/PurR family transcriptional regulator
MSITLKKIGDLTGTSPATVSRAIGGSTRVSKKTRERILAVAEQFHYRPNLAARSMVSRSTKLIGVILPMSSSGPFSRIIGGIESAARKAGYSVVFCQTEDDEKILNEHIKLLACRRVDGVLFCPDLHSRYSLSCLDQLGPMKTRPPVVLLQEPCDQDEYPNVVVDNFEGARMLGQHLISLGHFDIGFLAAFSSRTVQERCDGYRAALEEAGEDPRRVQFVKGHLKPGPLTADPYGYVDTDWLRDTLKKHSHWTALAADSDMMAIKLIQSLKKIGKRVPEDFAVVGFDDILVSAFIDPPLTTVRQPSWEVGSKACALLIDQIRTKTNGDGLTSIRVPCKLWVRQSCGCVGTKSSDPENHP